MSRQTDASRANGARSNGPVTDNGKAKSALNAIRHGLTSNRLIVLHNESPEDYARLAADFADTFRPANLAEGSLVQEMVNAQWKRQRAEVIETGLMDLALCSLDSELGKAGNGEEQSVRIALAYRKNFESDAKALSNIERQLVRLSRLFHRAHDKLKELQADRLRQESEDGAAAEPADSSASAAPPPESAMPANRGPGTPGTPGPETPANPPENAVFPNEPGVPPHNP